MCADMCVCVCVTHAALLALTREANNRAAVKLLQVRDTHTHTHTDAHTAHAVSKADGGCVCAILCLCMCVCVCVCVCVCIQDLFAAINKVEPRNAPLYYRMARAFGRLAGSDTSLLTVTCMMAERAVQLKPEHAPYVSVWGLYTHRHTQTHIYTHIHTHRSTSQRASLMQGITNTGGR